ncbi:EamA/RhaT family transporter [Luteibacter aegosomatissinici]|uniref:EamA family transporter n=1 Tax=Luteibacter aegosomatissinici TaxID=2911539 RepID=UPI001FF86B5D|nr:EamA/RhaT family transporter [Luteibacter aegosomatissinici]UPG94400.1 EamA/RhaT family transporter [Luteibacter aegosomatissinici]
MLRSLVYLRFDPMVYILLAVLFSVAVSVLLKLARRAGIDIVQAVATNYVVASLLAWQLLGATPQGVLAAKATWPPLIALGILLPAIFVVLAQSVRTAGIVRTDVAQRLSLFVSLFAAFVFLGDVLTGQKALGIGIALVAVLCVLWRKQKGTAEASGWWAPLLVFAGFGAIDICFKLVAKAGASFAAGLLGSFLIALVLCWIVALIRAVTGKVALTTRSIGFGVLLGAFNFANILFYVKGHVAMPNDPSLVFASMNVGVVVLGTLVGALGFREKLTAVNWVGIALAIAAIAVMTAS